MTLYLFPNLLEESLSHEGVFAPQILSALSSIQGLIAESEKGGRLFLRRFFPQTFREIPIQLLNEHTKSEELLSLLTPLMKGETWGLISDCGLPCLADPGANLVLLAQEKKIVTHAFCGPSSIILALMLSGLSAQAFAFHGYLERDSTRLKTQIQKLERRAREERAVQLCIEAPYRSQKLLSQLIATLSLDIRLSVACDLMSPTQKVETKTIKAWRASPLFHVDKKPCVFLFNPTCSLPCPRD